MATKKMTMPKKAAPTKKPAAKAAPKAAAGKKPAPPIMTLKHFAADLSDQHNMAKKDCEQLLNDFVAQIGKTLKRGAKIRISGLGILQVRHRQARMGRNPATGEAIKIKASKKIAFRAAKDLKESI